MTGSVEGVARHFQQGDYWNRRLLQALPSVTPIGKGFINERILQASRSLCPALHRHSKGLGRLGREAGFVKAASAVGCLEGGRGQQVAFLAAELL